MVGPPLPGRRRRRQGGPAGSRTATDSTAFRRSRRRWPRRPWPARSSSTATSRPRSPMTATGTFTGGDSLDTAGKVVSQTLMGSRPGATRSASTRDARSGCRTGTTRSRWCWSTSSGWTGRRCSTSRSSSAGACSSRSSPRRTSSAAARSSGRRSTRGWARGGRWASRASRSRPPTAATHRASAALDWASVAMPRR